MSEPYHIASEGFPPKSVVLWKGRARPLASCINYIDAKRVCDALNFRDRLIDLAIAEDTTVEAILFKLEQDSAAKQLEKILKP